MSDHKEPDGCPSTSPLKEHKIPYVCTLDNGHDGPHVAHDVADRVLETWTDAPDVERLYEGACSTGKTKGNWDVFRAEAAKLGVEVPSSDEVFDPTPSPLEVVREALEFTVEQFGNTAGHDRCEDPGTCPWKEDHQLLDNSRAALAALEEVEANTVKLTEQKDGAYSERNKLVAALAKLMPAQIARHPESDTQWEDDWRWIVFVYGEAGQMSWHIHDSEREAFRFLKEGPNEWDGHDIHEKYRRLERLAPKRMPADLDAVARDIFSSIWWDENEKGERRQKPTNLLPERMMRWSRALNHHLCSPAPSEPVCGTCSGTKLKPWVTQQPVMPPCPDCSAPEPTAPFTPDELAAIEQELRDGAPELKKALERLQESKRITPELLNRVIGSAPEGEREAEERKMHADEVQSLNASATKHWQAKELAERRERELEADRDTWRACFQKSALFASDICAAIGFTGEAEPEAIVHACKKRVGELEAEVERLKQQGDVCRGQLEKHERIVRAINEHLGVADDDNLDELPGCIKRYAEEHLAMCIRANEARAKLTRLRSAGGAGVPLTEDEKRQRGLYEKFNVSRVDGSSATGGKHRGCEYFVLDLDHDEHAGAALAAYAESCHEAYPLLARDLRAKLPVEHRCAPPVAGGLEAVHDEHCYLEAGLSWCACSSRARACSGPVAGDLERVANELRQSDFPGNVSLNCERWAGEIRAHVCPGLSEEDADAVDVALIALVRLNQARYAPVIVRLRAIAARGGRGSEA